MATNLNNLGSLVFPNGPVTLYPPAPVVKKSRRRTVWDKALDELRKQPSQTNDVSTHYKSVSPDLVISVLGKINPVYRGRPKKLPLFLLGSAMFANRPGLLYVSSGLTYSDHCVKEKYKQKGRLTATGLRLLEHWARVYPSFAPFFEAYVPKKARKEIMADSFDLEMNVLPKRVRELKARHDAIMAHEAEVLAEAAKIEAAKRKYVSSKSTQNASALHNALIQQQYYNHLNQMNQQNIGWANTTAGAAPKPWGTSNNTTGGNTL